MKKLGTLLLVCYTLYVNAQTKDAVVLGQSIQNISISSADFDLDGDLDIVTAEGIRDVIVVFMNLDGLGTMDTGVVITNTASEVTGIVSGDIDNDGDADILYSSYGDDMIAWHENLGAGIFGQRQIISTQIMGASSIFIQDMNNDGKIDVLTSSKTNGEIGWFENLGSGMFGPYQMISNLTNGVNSVFSEDLDNDGDYDVLSASENDGKLAWYENLGGGVFSTQKLIFTFNVKAKFVVAADTDNDGDIDVLSISTETHFNNSYLDSSEINFFENLGAGIFGAKQLLANNNAIGNAVGFEAMLTEDMDNDGDLDLVVTPARHNYYENLGAGIFQAKDTISNNPKYGIHLSDIDGDTYKEIINRRSWAKNNNGTFVPNSYNYFFDTLSSSSNLDMAIADFDGDGKLDIISSINFENKIELRKNLGKNEIGKPSVVDSNNTAIELIDVDIDLDGDIDLLARTNETTSLILYVNDGNANFTKILINDSVPFGANMYSSDIDLDGDMDILLSSTNIVWYENVGGFMFSQPKIISPIAGFMAIGDIDGDMDIDVVQSGSFNSKEIKIYENTGLGSGIFNLKQTINLPNWIKGISELKDLDQDGDVDVLTSTHSLPSGSHALLLMRNDGFGSFNGGTQVIYSQPPGIITNGHYILNPSIIDINADGINDALFTDDHFTQISGPITRGIFWLEGMGGGLFGSRNTIHNSITSSWYEYRLDKPGDILIVDFNNDGDDDVVLYDMEDLSHKNISAIFLFENQIFDSKQVRGKLYIDQNQNGNLDSAEAGANWLKMVSNPTHDYAYTFSNGNYILNFKDTTGNYQVMPALPQYWKITSDSLLYHVTVDTSFNYVDSLDFGIYPDTIINMLNAELIGAFPRCNEIVNYWIDVKNNGTSVPSGIIHLQLADSITYLNASNSPDSINGQNIYWHYDSLFYFSNTQINLLVQMPSLASVGDTLISYIHATVLDSMGNTVYVNTDSLDQILVCAYDPNDKIATPRGRDTLGYIPASTPNIEYTVRFQNTGNDTAITVIIKDQLDVNLQWQTLTPLASSHPMLIDVDQNGLVSFKFNNIMLPDSGADFLGSQGFVRYNISLKPNLPIGTQLFNTANIYFDQNPAVITNTKIHTIDSTSSVSINDLTNENLDVIIYPNPFTNFTTIEFKEDLKGEYDMYVYDIVGKEIHSELKLTGNKFVLQQSVLGKGIYLINLVNNKTGRKFTRKVIAQ